MLNNIPAPCNERMSGIDSKIVGIFYNLITITSQFFTLSVKCQGSISIGVENTLLYIEETVRYNVALKVAFINFGIGAAFTSCARETRNKYR